MHTLGMAHLGGATLDNEENYLIKKLFTGGPGNELHQQPGPNMTQLHGARSGHLVRTRRRHDGTTRSRACRRHPDHGLIDGGKPSGRLPVGDGGARARRQDHPRRSAVYAHVGDGRHLGADATRHRHPLPRRADQLRPRPRKVLPRIRRSLHQRAIHSSRGLSRHRGSRRCLLRLGSQKKKKYKPESWLYEGRASPRVSPCKPGQSDVAGGHGQRGGEAGYANKYTVRSDAAASALRLPGAEAALRALHAGDGRAILRRAEGRIS